MSAILFGSISTLVDTSELQRRAFNEAFAAHGLDWNWTRDDYTAMLGSNGGAARIADFASSRGEDVDAAAVHATKSELFQKLISAGGVSARPGVVETLTAAKNNNVKLGFVTTTSPENVAAVLDSLAPDVTRETFDVIVDSSTVSESKPDAASYAYALRSLSENASDCIAIEDNVGGVAAANAAGVRCIAFPNENTATGDFSSAVESVDALDSTHVSALAGV